MRRRWIEGVGVFAALLGLLGCAVRGRESTPVPGEGLTHTRGVVSSLSCILGEDANQDVSVPRVEATVTNTEREPLRNLVVEFNAVPIGKDRPVGNYYEQINLLPPGKSKTISWAPKMPPDARSAPCRIRVQAFSVEEQGEGRSKNEIGYQEIILQPLSPEPSAPASRPETESEPESLRDKFL